MNLPFGDLPAINPSYTCKKNRYVYSTTSRGKSSFMECIARIDLNTNEIIYWEHEHHTPGEAIFVPIPSKDGTETEDAGVLLSVILDGDKGTSYLLCLNARDLRELGRAEVPVAVGLGFMGGMLSCGMKFSRVLGSLYPYLWFDVLN
jgi:torulene dioxygenase